MKMGDSFRKDINITLKIFKTLVMPILLYLADYWGCLKLPKNNPIEVIQNSFLKQLLGVQSQTTNIGVLLETGEIPLSCYAKKLCIKNWCRIARGMGNNIVQHSYKNAVANNSAWPNRIQQELTTVGLFEMYLSAANNTKHVDVVFFQRLIDIFHQTAFSQIREPQSKLRTYSLIKSDIGLEKYLSEVKNITDRTNMTKLRLSNHSLLIEKGRHLKIEKNLRFCPFCPRSIEDELHFVISCKTYKCQRKLLFQEMRENCVGFELLSSDEQFKTLFTETSIAKVLARYLSNNFEIRNFLLLNPKNNI